MKRFSRPKLREAKALLHAVRLPADDLTEKLLEHFLGCHDNGKLIAMGGLELFGEHALLRSLATLPDYANQGYASRLVTALESRANTAGVTQLYLLTTTADGYFRGRGYRDASRETAPQSIAQSRQFGELCPATAVFMYKPLAD